MQKCVRLCVCKCFFCGSWAYVCYYRFCWPYTVRMSSLWKPDYTEISSSHADRKRKKEKTSWKIMLNSSSCALQPTLVRLKVNTIINAAAATFSFRKKIHVCTPYIVTCCCCCCRCSAVGLCIWWIVDACDFFMWCKCKQEEQHLRYFQSLHTDTHMHTHTHTHACQQYNDYARERRKIHFKQRSQPYIRSTKKFCLKFIVAVQPSCLLIGWEKVIGQNNNYEKTMTLVQKKRKIEIDGEKEHDEYERSNKKEHISCTLCVSVWVCVCALQCTHMFPTSRWLLW